MKPLTSSALRGTWGTVLLPINQDDSIDFGRLAESVRLLCASGVHGIYSNGTAGEFFAQTEAEFDRVNETVAGEAERTGTPFQLGACHLSAQLMLERVKRARAFAPSGIQVILPDWVRIGMDEATTFLSRIAEAAGPVPLILYNPPHAKRVFTVGEIASLRLAVPSLCGVKVGDGQPSWYAAMRVQLPDFSVFVPGHHYATGRAAGAHGSYSNVACINPRAARAWDDLIGSDLPAALEVERRILDFFSRHVAPLGAQGYQNMALDKLLCSLGGWCDVGLRLRWPYRSMDPAVAAALRPLIRQALPEFFGAA